jgi:hypothetical protein
VTFARSSGVIIMFSLCLVASISCLLPRLAISLRRFFETDAPRALPPELLKLFASHKLWGSKRAIARTNSLLRAQAAADGFASEVVAHRPDQRCCGKPHRTAAMEVLTFAMPAHRIQPGRATPVFILSTPLSN